MDGRILNAPRTLFMCASLAALAALAACSGCSEVATVSVDEGSGPQPVLPPPKRTLIPTMDIAPAVHWSAGEAPTPAAGLAVGAFATGLDHPRWRRGLGAGRRRDAHRVPCDGGRDRLPVDGPLDRQGKR
jgi:glucose/arabinose dehydrogenase